MMETYGLGKFRFRFRTLDLVGLKDERYMILDNHYSFIASVCTQTIVITISGITT